MSRKSKGNPDYYRRLAAKELSEALGRPEAEIYQALEGKAVRTQVCWKQGVKTVKVVEIVDGKPADVDLEVLNVRIG